MREKIDTWFLANANQGGMFAVNAAADQTRKIVRVNYENQGGTRKILGYNWFLDRWFQGNQVVDLFVSTASPGYVLDDLTGVLDDYPTPPLRQPVLVRRQDQLRRLQGRWPDVPVCR